MSTTDTERDERLREARADARGWRRHPAPHLAGRAIVTLDDEIARLDAVVTAVRDLHVPGQWETDGPGALYRDCVACAQPYPCWTVRALDGGAR